MKTVDIIFLIRLVLKNFICEKKMYKAADFNYENSDLLLNEGSGTLMTAKEWAEEAHTWDTEIESVKEQFFKLKYLDADEYYSSHDSLESLGEAFISEDINGNIFYLQHFYDPKFSGQEDRVTLRYDIKKFFKEWKFNRYQLRDDIDFEESDLCDWKKPTFYDRF